MKNDYYSKKLKKIHERALEKRATDRLEAGGPTSRFNKVREKVYLLKDLYSRFRKPIRIFLFIVKTVRRALHAWNFITERSPDLLHLFL